MTAPALATTSGFCQVGSTSRTHRKSRLLFLLSGKFLFRVAVRRFTRRSAWAVPRASYKRQTLAGRSSRLQPSSESIQFAVLRFFEGWLRRRWWLGEWLLYRWPIRLMFSGFNQAVTCVPGVGCGDG